MSRENVRCWALACAVSAGACTTGDPSAPAYPAPADATAVLEADAAVDATSDLPDADEGGDDATPFEGFEGSLSFDGCVATGTCPPAVAIELAGGQSSPAGIAIDATNVYWVDVGWASVDGGPRAGSEVMKCAKTGCAGNPTVLASGAWAGASKLGVDDAGVFWILSDSVVGCPLGGCTGSPQVLWSGQGPLYDIAVDSTGVYFTSRGSQALYRCPFDGCDGGGLLWPLPDGGVTGGPSAVVLDSTSVYFVDTFGEVVRACEKADCAGTARIVAVSTDFASLAQLAVDDANVYVTDLGQRRILWAPKTASAASLSVLVTGLSLPVGIASDGAKVFYTDTGQPDAGSGGGGRVAECPVGGCAGTGRAVAGYVNQPLDVVVDDAGIYWTDFGGSNDPAESDSGSVMFAPKP